MLCFRKFNNQFKKDLLLKKMMVKEELKRQQNNNNDNAVQVLYNENENEGRNFLDGYYLYYVKGLEECQKHTEGMYLKYIFFLGSIFYLLLFYFLIGMKNDEIS